MRIIAGTHKGRTIKLPDTRQARPTTDRIRESLMSSIASQRGGFEHETVLDCFAGSGALGLESLSRGADFAVFYENSARIFAALKDNIDSLGLGHRSTCYRADIHAVPRIALALSGPYSLVYMDPPYDTTEEKIMGLVRRLEAEQALLPGALIVVERGQEMVTPFPLAFEKVFEKRYGSTFIVMAEYTP